MRRLVGDRLPSPFFYAPGEPTTCRAAESSRQALQLLVVALDESRAPRVLRQIDAEAKLGNTASSAPLAWLCAARLQDASVKFPGKSPTVGLNCASAYFHARPLEYVWYFAIAHCGHGLRVIESQCSIHAALRFLCPSAGIPLPSSQLAVEKHAEAPETHFEARRTSEGTPDSAVRRWNSSCACVNVSNSRKRRRPKRADVICGKSDRCKY